MKKLIYLDAGLNSEHGHHATTCRRLCAEFRRRGIGTTIHGPREVTDSLRSELDINPHFAVGTYWTCNDPVSGWLETFSVSSSAFHEDLARLRAPRPGDIVFLNSATPGQLMGLARWLGGFSRTDSAQVLVEFGHEPGLEPQIWPPGEVYHPRDPRKDPRAAFYRAAVNAIPAALAGTIRYFTFDAHCSTLFSALLNREVRTLPSIHSALKFARTNNGDGPVTVSIIGTQRVDKGYHLVPQIVTALLQVVPELCVLIHNSGPSWMPQEQAVLRGMSSSNSRLRLFEEPAGEAAWRALLAQTDIMVCPYDPIRYHTSYSSVAVESVANGIPLVVPRHTTLHQLVSDYGDCGASFDVQSVAAIVESVRHVAENHAAYKASAEAASTKWSAVNGVQRTVDCILSALAGETDPMPSLPDHRVRILNRVPSADALGPGKGGPSLGVYHPNPVRGRPNSHAALGWLE